MEDIKDIRENINKVDDKIIKLLEERFDLSKKVRAYKISHNKKVYDPIREKEILKKIQEKNPEYGKYFVKIYQEIMDQSKNLQRNDENYGLLGKKLGHSYSKIIHEKIGYYDYQYFEKNQEDLDDFFEKKDFKGINVTIPYKEKVIKYLDFVSDKAKKIGAVNTIVNKNGKLYGYNSDYYGFLYNLKKNKIDVKDKKCLILGKGASSKTVEAVLKDLGAKEVVFLSRRFKPYFKDEKNYRDFEIIVNTTPVGMYPNNGEFLDYIKLDNFKKLEGLVDLIYNPNMTRILIEAKLKNIKYACGIDMLIAQAVKASELFLDKNFDQDLITKIRNSLMKNQLNIALIGMPGSGKTSLGRILAENMKRNFIDLDLEFEKKYGNIEEFFKNYGEDKFRYKESQILKEFSKKTGQIISCGGGIVEKEENYYRLKENSIIVNVKRDLENLEIEGRPLSKKYDLEFLYNKRKDLYDKFKDFEVYNIDLDKCAKEIEEKFYENISN
ncbi:shikimate kinase [Anaerococcus hydrogenalis]|uniref:Shikimate kinase n=1 Tax=Anaerococcus hydrogenalis ACS-025-V-Sch4 TaxID=879306 RepID=F0H2W0_9FIRM|nr:shikimate kinase [Anaerococcus hydrogenalis]EGC83188.1 shikimate kinase [Anaerococcus hydrogenalis ACS-025-V-Sch4]